MYVKKISNNAGWWNQTIVKWWFFLYTGWPIKLFIFDRKLAARASNLQILRKNLVLIWQESCENLARIWRESGENLATIWRESGENLTRIWRESLLCSMYVLGWSKNLKIWNPTGNFDSLRMPDPKNPKLKIIKLEPDPNPNFGFRVFSGTRPENPNFCQL